MKKFRRLAALLLAGVMALAVLSGCGSSAFERDIETTVIRYANAMASQTLGEDAKQFTNDQQIRQKAYDMLGCINPKDGLIDVSKADMYIREYQVDKFVITEIHIVADEFSGDKMLATEVTQEKLDEAKQELDKIQNRRDGNPFRTMTAFGVAARTINGKTYLAMGYTYEDSRT